MNNEDIRESTKNIGRVTETNGVLPTLTGSNGEYRGLKTFVKKTVPHNLRKNDPYSGPRAIKGAAYEHPGILTATN